MIRKKREYAVGTSIMDGNEGYANLGRLAIWNLANKHIIAIRIIPNYK